jgi:polyhydroxybutyrate depolymerase
MKSRILFILLIGVSICSCDKEWKGDGDEEKQRITVDGEKRTYRVYTPANYDASKEYPLILTLHGRFGTAKGMDKFSGMNPIADEKEFIVVYPDGYKRSWADDRQFGPAFEDGIDDYAFFNALLDQLIADYPIDEDRIYACGMSNGGFMSLSLACHLSDRIAAVAAVTGAMGPGPEDYCNEAKPTAILLIGGVDDPTVPYDGGDISEGSITIGFPAAFEFWRDQNQCVDTVKDSVWNDMDDSDGTTVITHSHISCDSMVNVVLYEVEGMGHTWPQGTQYLKEDRIGKVSQEFNGARTIADFLLSFELK